jgi:ketosteroid isomerase-like protein
MKSIMRLLLRVTLTLAAAAVFAQDAKRDYKTEHERKGKNNNERAAMNIKENINVVREIFSAIERRDERRFLELLHSDFEIHWPPSLPYGGTSRGPKHGEPTWIETWIPLQPTEAERRMNPRVVAAGEDEVVVLWRQRGVTPAGDRFDGEVLGLYQLREGKLARAQMFYFDTAALVRFLSKAREQATATKQ